jgi:hypothetical protein
MPFKLKSKGMIRISRQRHRDANRRENEASVRDRDGPIIWFAPDAVAGRNAWSRITPYGQRDEPDFAIETALALRAVSNGASPERKADRIYHENAEDRPAGSRSCGAEPASVWVACLKLRADRNERTSA